MPKFYTSLAPDYPLSLTRQVIGTGALGYFQGRYFLAEFPSLFILSADIDHIIWVRLIVDDVFRGDPVEFDEFVHANFRVYYFD